MPVRQDDRRIASDVRLEPGGYRLLTLVGGAVGTQGAEGDGVNAALGRKVAAESEHVRPSRQAHFFQSGKFAEAQAFGDEAAGVLAYRQRGELIGGGDAAVESAGAFGGF